MKNRNRIFAGILVLVMFMLSIPGIAATETVINPVTAYSDTVTVSGVVPTPKSRVYIEITRKGADILDEANVYASRIITAGEEGEFSVNCRMPAKDRKNSEESIDGYFTVHVITAGVDNKTLDFSYVTEENRIKFLADLNIAKSGDLKGFLNNENNKIYFDLYNVLIDEYYTNSDEKKTIVCSILSKNEADFTADNIVIINDAIITSRLNSMSGTDVVKSILESEEIFSKCDLTYNDEGYESLSQEKKDWFYEVVLANSQQNKFSDIAQLNDIFDEAMVLYEVNNTHYSKLFDVLNTKKDVLKMTSVSEFATVSGMTDAGKTGVMQEIKAISDSVKSIDELAVIFKNGYNNYIIKMNTVTTPSYGGGGNSGGGSGGSSSGKGSNILTTGAISKTESVKKDETEVKDEYFNDLSGYEWAKEAINVLASAKIVSGDGNGAFNPGNNVTRAEFVTMLMNAIDMVDNSAQCDFSDIDKNSWCYKYVASAFEEGITSGVSDDYFGKDESITRQEAAAFLHRAAVRIYIPLNNDTSEGFADSDKIAPWALRSVNIMKAAGLINGIGDGLFDPYGVTTRAQAAKMIYGLYKLA